MGRLLMRVRALPDSTQKVVVFGVLACAIAAIVVVAQALG
jgi:hypothetical protein